MKLKNAFIKIYVLCFVVMLFLSSCIRYPLEIKHSIEISGKNKNELIMVINHYIHNKEDSLKLKAAIYLIKNMEGLYSLDTTSVIDNEQYFNCLDTMYKKINTPTIDLVSKTLDEYIKDHNITPGTPNVRYVEDLKVVTAKFLIKNIDSAFTSWQSNSWSSQMSFDVFCEYILPYRSINTYMENSKRYFMNKYSWVGDSVQGEKDCFKVEHLVKDEINTWYMERLTLIAKYPFLSPIKFSNIIKGRIGTCEQGNALKADALRALGVPVGMEYIPQWGNNNSAHSFYKILDSRYDTIKKLLTNINSPQDVNHIVSGIISGYSTTIFTGVEELPPFIVPLYNKTIPKIYRKCYTRQLKSLAVLNSGNEEIPVFFQDDHLLDITDHYLETADVNLKVDSKDLYRYAYLCVFNIHGWKPIQWAAVTKNGDALFKNMGKNVVYLTAFYKNGELIPFGNPFLIEQNGSIRNIDKGNKLQTLYAWRKYPYYIHIAEYASFMIGGRFQGANRTDLTDSKTFYKINTLPYCMKETPVVENKKYRYLIYNFSGLWQAFPAEIEFYGIVNNKEVKLKGHEFGNKGLYGFTSSLLWDGDRNSYFRNDVSQAQAYVGIDLGENKQCKITKIRFCPRNDTNDILPDQHYELFYWNNRWVSLGNQKGIDMKPLIFCNAPENALFWLHTDKGMEERIFTYENGKQVWW